MFIAVGPATAYYARYILGDISWTAPITLVRGERGFVTEDDAADFRARVPEASVLVVPSGHNVQEELPAPLAALVFDIAEG